MDWNSRLSHSSLRNEPCRTCSNPFERWEAGEVRCPECRKIKTDKYRGINFGGSKFFKREGHSFTTVDGKEYYMDEYVSKGIYKKYIDYEEQEKKPLLDHMHRKWIEQQGASNGTTVPNMPNDGDGQLPG